LKRIPCSGAWERELPSRAPRALVGHVRSRYLANQLGLRPGTQITKQHSHGWLVNLFMFEQVLRQRLEFFAMHFEDLASPLVHALDQRLRFIIDTSGGGPPLVPLTFYTTI